MANSATQQNLNIATATLNRMKTILWLPTGPMLRYADGVIEISDLNPELKTEWALGRWRTFTVACRLAIAALVGR